ncbi:MAG: 16S rRNA (uracil(1498)-N(3))-methyltransferase [Ruminococcaceae bacterium]|nr:16S rRNA (uracil(1498)-N(3))-methyltransferase [Oscillospiraceae bacterium]
MSKFFVEKKQITDIGIEIIGTDVNHIVKVLRAKIGDTLVICDGEGIDYEAVIEALSKDSVKTKIIRSYPCKTEPKTKVTLYQGLPKQGKMEWIIEKCTEIGIHTIVPVQMTRSVVKLSEEQAQKKLERWQKTAEAAAKQCGRGLIPQIKMPITISELSKEDLPEFLLLPYEDEQANSVKTALSSKKEASAGIFIGPEGGFAPDEVVQLKGLGAKTVTLGPRILRTETAGSVALSLLLYEWDEMNCF